MSTTLDLGRVTGYSAYEIAVQQGYEGTEAEWADSISRLQNQCISTTLTQAVNALTFTQGDDGLALNAKVLQFDIRVPAGCTVPTGTTSYIRARFNGVSTGYYEYGYPTSNRDSVLLGMMRNQKGFGQTRVAMYGNYANSVCAAGYYDGTNSGKGQLLYETPDLGLS